MVSSILVDAINNPSTALSELYQSAGQHADFPALVSSHFSNIFRSPGAFQQVWVSFRHLPSLLILLILDTVVERKKPS
jgi:hypothetical protein